jgi:hypothetical protein
MIVLAAVGAVLVALLTARSTRWAGVGRWAALAMVGQAALLQLVRAGPSIRYEHVGLPGDWTARELVAALVLLGQGLVVGWALARRRSELAAFTAVGRWRFAIALVVFLLASSALSPSPSTYLAEIGLRSVFQLIAIGNAILIGLAVPAPVSLAGRLGSARWLALTAGLTTLVAGLLAWIVYQRHPHVPDEVTYLIQAGYFAAGRLGLVAPSVPGAFNVDLLYYEPTRIYSAFPPGWPAVLAVGVRVGLGWLVNPILAGLNVLLCHRLLRACYDRRTATLGALLLALSPWHLFLGMSFMSHTLTLTLALGAALLVVGGLQSGQRLKLVGGGLFIGAVSLIRPLDGLVLAGTLGLVVVLAPGSVGRRLVRGGILAAATAATALLVLPYNAALTGRGSVFPVMLYFDRYYAPGSNDMGFGPNRGVGWSGIDPLPGHGLTDVIINALINLFQVNTELFGWAAGSLTAVLLLVLRRHRWSPVDLAMLLAMAVVVGLHSFYWFSGGPDFGARYWFLLIVPVIALAARGLRAVDEGPAAASADDPSLGRGETTGLILSLVALVVMVPWRATDKYWHFRRMEGGIPALAKQHQFGRALVLVQGARHPDYHGAAVYNPVDLVNGEGPIYAWDRTPALRAALLAAYPDRAVWIVAGPTVSGDGYRVVAGPLTAESAAKLEPGPEFPVPPGPNP